jgi:hypothetical protein
MSAQLCVEPRGSAHTWRLTPRSFRASSGEKAKMNIGKTLAVSAVSGILVGVLAGCGGGAASTPPAAAPAADGAQPAAKDCCKGKNECKGKSGCKAGANASCAGQNSCKGQGTSCPKG